MKKIVLLLIIGMVYFSSCKKEDIMDYPAHYQYDGFEVVSISAFQIQNGEYVRLSMDEVGEPNMEILKNEGVFSEVEIVDEDNISVKEDAWIDNIKLNMSENILTFQYEGDQVLFNGEPRKDRLVLETISSGKFDSGPYNLFKTGICNEGEDCHNVNYDNWLFGESWMAEEAVVYVVSKKEFYTKK